jgi:iron complex outermembrane recepter protein
MTKSFHQILFAAAAVSALTVGSAYAQGVSQLEEIVVTAERTESTAQRTPISLAVVSGEELQAQGVSTLSLLTQVEPTVVFNSGQFANASITVRGISSSGSTDFGGSAVSINTDGQYIYSGFNGALFDIARVEVLKGPQGTLYGLNSTAGAINILTNAPALGAFTFGRSGELRPAPLRRCGEHPDWRDGRPADFRPQHRA